MIIFTCYNFQNTSIISTSRLRQDKAPNIMNKVHFHFHPMMKKKNHVLFFLFLFHLPCLSLSLNHHNDTHALTLFRRQADLHGSLLQNWTGGDACSAAWRGVRCSPNGRVTSLSLPSLNLRGTIDPLTPLTHLRLLDLHENRLNGTVSPLLSNCTNLKLLYLAGNDFSGEIPPEISSVKGLLRLDLSDNNIHGNLPKELSHLTQLLTLRLQNNVLSGHIPDLSSSMVNLRELNMTNNGFYGQLPNPMLKKFGYESFSGNEGLCGNGSTPLPVCSSTETTPPSFSEPVQTVPSNPSSLPQTSVIARPENQQQQHKGLSPGAIVAIVVANCVALLVVTSFVVAHCCARGRSSNSFVGSGESGKRKSGSSYGSEKKVYANDGGGGGGCDSDGTNGTDRSKLVFFDRRSEFELEDLLRASAEMLGKGSLGTVYRAVLDDGSTVAVKRLKDANPCARNEFEQYMDVIGKLKHRNIVRLRAYYYAKEEKLLVYDYLSNGSLHALLHGLSYSIICFLCFDHAFLTLLYLSRIY